VDPHHIYADPDSTNNPDEDPDSDFYLMRIRIRFFTPDADPDQGHSFKKRLKPLK
jgi:hypothetical protein